MVADLQVDKWLSIANNPQNLPTDERENKRLFKNPPHNKIYGAFYIKIRRTWAELKFNNHFAMLDSDFNKYVT